MATYKLLRIAFPLVVLLNLVHSVTHIPIDIISNPTSVVREYDPSIANLFRDGGVGTYVGGYHLQLFQDTFTTESADFTGSMTSWSSNSIAYMGLPDGSDPASVHTIGVQEDGNTQILSYAINNNLDSGGYFPVQANETTQPPPGEYASPVAIWPNAVATLPGNQSALVVAAVFDRATKTELYNTLYTVNVSDSTSIDQLPVERAVDYGLFYNDEILFGDLGVMIGLHYQELFLFASVDDQHGVKLAKVPVDKFRDRSQYQYYYQSSRSWSSQIPLDGSSADNIFNAWSDSKVVSASFYYSYFHKTYVAIAQLLDQYSAPHFYATYSISGWPEGPWAPLSHLFDPPLDHGCNEYDPIDRLVYYGHAFPAWYGPDSEQLLVGWAQCTAYYSLATITFRP